MAIIWKGLGNETLDLEEAFDLIIDDKTQKIEYMQEVAKKSNDLIKKELLRTESSNFFNDTQFILTDKSIQLLEECHLSLSFNTESKNDCISPDEIVTKELFFSDEQTQKLQLLKNLLIDDQYKQIQDRLKGKGLPSGITFLFHGVPGTGKTEMVKQLAKLSNRELMKVNISQAKSKWFGESEKRVKLIFDDYKKYAKSAKRTPILFFNEADALISKRTSNASNQQFNTQQTENTLQNILLDELENFDGILAATTNMVENIDSAFDRRFLYKIQFDKPTLAIRAKIWKEKLPMLTKKQCESLANSYNLTGGQIDNIVRKMEIEEIIKGDVLKYGRVASNCEDELLRQRNNEQIGFKFH